MISGVEIRIKNNCFQNKRELLSIGNSTFPITSSIIPPKNPQSTYNGFRVLVDLGKRDYARQIRETREVLLRSAPICRGAQRDPPIPGVATLPHCIGALGTHRETRFPMEKLVVNARFAARPGGYPGFVNGWPGDTR